MWRRMSEHPVDAASLRAALDEQPRSQCACMGCISWCCAMPGALAPGDLERIQTYVGNTSEAFVETHFVASEGALVQRGGDTFRIPSITPAQKPDGACVFLDEHMRCSIHAVAPFGCSHFDCKQASPESNYRLRLLISAQAQAFATNDTYAQQHQHLAAAGHRAPPLHVRRARYSAAMQTNSSTSQESHEPKTQEE